MYRWRDEIEIVNKFFNELLHRLVACFIRDDVLSLLSVGFILLFAFCRFELLLVEGCQARESCHSEDDSHVSECLLCCFCIATLELFVDQDLQVRLILDL